jgi:hypothetical protein
LKQLRDFNSNSVADRAEGVHDLFIAALSFGWVREAMVRSAALSQPNRTFLRRRITYRDDHIEICIPKFIGGLRAAFVLDADFLQGLQSLRMNVASWLRSRTDSLPAMPQLRIDDRFRHLAASGIASAEEQDPLFGHMCRLERPTGCRVEDFRSLAGRIKVETYS